MNMTFKIKMFKEWTLTDDKIVCGNKEIKLCDITEVEHSPAKQGKSAWTTKNGVISIQCGEGVENYHSFGYLPERKEDGETAYEYILCHSSEKLRKKAMESEKFGDAEDYYMQCDFCKHVFHYTKDDLIDDEKTRKAAYRQKTMGELTAIGISMHTGNSEVHRANEKLSQIPDRDKCPKCGGEKLTRLFEEEAKAKIEKQNNPVQAVSSADEIKKFKELLDMGVITQEEFDQKKKQLLGL